MVVSSRPRVLSSVPIWSEGVRGGYIKCASMISILRFSRFLYLPCEIIFVNFTLCPFAGG